MADAPQNEAPEGLETKEAPVVTGGGRDSTIGYRSAPVPHTNHTGSGMLDGHDVHESATTGKRDDAEQDEGPGITSESGGTQARPAVGRAAKK